MHTHHSNRHTLPATTRRVIITEEALQSMLAIIIIIPSALGYKSTLLNLPYKLHQYLVFTYLSKITSNTPAKAKYLQFTLLSPSPLWFCSYWSLCLEHSLTSPPGQFSWASYTFNFVSCFPGTSVADACLCRSARYPKVTTQSHSVFPSSNGVSLASTSSKKVFKKCWEGNSGSLRV